MSTVNTGWLKNNNGEKFAPKTLSSQIITNDGTSFESKLSSDLANIENNIISEFSKYETKTDAVTKLDEAKDYTNTAISNLINSAPTTLDTLGEIATAMEENADVVEALESAIGKKANASDLTSHTGNKSNPHGVTKSQVGLGNVENKSSATIRGEITKSNVTSALGYTPYTPTEVDSKLSGKANASHNHDDRYYTESEVDSKLSDKADKSDVVQSDWNQNDETAADYIKNRTHWFEEEEIDIIPEGTYVVDADTDMAMIDTVNAIPIVGQTYIVTYNNVEYECVASEFVEDGVVGATLGNVGALSGENPTDEPFVILILGVFNAIVPLDGNETVTLSVVGNRMVYHKISNEYLPKFSENLVDGVRGSIRAVSSCEETGDYILGEYAVALGCQTTASGDYSHAEGAKTTASGSSSHAEGANTTASGSYSHAEGFSTTASGDCSHAEGSAKASGDYSHAEGRGTVASGIYQHVQGKYNINDVDTNGKILNTYAHIVGNGTDTNKRSNAHTLDWSGNAWYQGGVYVGGTSQTDATPLTTVQMITWGADD